MGSLLSNSTCFNFYPRRRKDSDDSDGYSEFDIDELPFDCVRHILSFLDTKDLCSVMRVNKEMRAFARSQPVWKYRIDLFEESRKVDFSHDEELRKEEDGFNRYKRCLHLLDDVIFLARNCYCGPESEWNMWENALNFAMNNLGESEVIISSQGDRECEVLTECIFTYEYDEERKKLIDIKEWTGIRKVSTPVENHHLNMFVYDIPKAGVSKRLDQAWVSSQSNNDKKRVPGVLLAGSVSGGGLDYQKRVFESTPQRQMYEDKQIAEALDAAKSLDGVHFCIDFFEECFGDPTRKGKVVEEFDLFLRASSKKCGRMFERLVALIARASKHLDDFKELTF